MITTEKTEYGIIRGRAEVYGLVDIEVVGLVDDFDVAKKELGSMIKKMQDKGICIEKIDEVNYKMTIGTREAYSYSVCEVRRLREGKEGTK